MKDPKKTNRTRRQRGYAFETSIAKLFNKSNYWIAKRLGSPSTNLPDVMAVNNTHLTMISMEAKSTVGDVAYIPQDQIERCIEWNSNFYIYKNQIVILAFKFGQVAGEKKLTTFYKVFPSDAIPNEVKCKRNGRIYLKHGEKWVLMNMEDYKLEA